ncbi:unnamed protein product [Gongylonema pulchrum]|uniref:Chloride channel protein 2 n=1 Tax=Gongylonema pulchrum TaxID=637853 RepID=A0A183ESS8_9BILA|nr:unnamed protein product [Gongylonema pulchrum]
MVFFSLDPNEDPVTGLERVASLSCLSAEERRQRRQQMEREFEESRQRQRCAIKDAEAVSSRFESLNYEILENDLYRAEEKEPGHQESRQRQRCAIKDAEAVSSRFESLNYEILENDLYRAEEKEPGHQQKLFRQTVNRWVVCFFIGVLTGCVAAAIDITIYYSSQIKFHLIINNCKCFFFLAEFLDPFFFLYSNRQL